MVVEQLGKEYRVKDISKAEWTQGNRRFYAARQKIRSEITQKSS
jgi:hypothetical protein